MDKNRKWLFVLLVLVGAALMFAGWFMPWWTIDVEGFATDVVQIRPWGLCICEQMGDFAILMKGAELPAFFAPFMWSFLGLCVVALLVGIVIKEASVKIGKLTLKWSQILVGGVGLAYIVMAIVAAVFASYRMGTAFGAPLQGRAFIDMGDPLIAYVDTRLLPGYYVLYAAGLTLLLVGIFRDKIINKTEN